MFVLLLELFVLYLNGYDSLFSLGFYIFLSLSLSLCVRVLHDSLCTSIYNMFFRKQGHGKGRKMAKDSELILAVSVCPSLPYF